MRKLTEYLKNNPDMMLILPALLCAFQFILGLFGMFRIGIFDNPLFNQLLSSADGLETACLATAMALLKK